MKPYYPDAANQSALSLMKSFLLYIDPGSGSYLVQVIIAAVLGGLFYFKNFWRRDPGLFLPEAKRRHPQKTTRTMPDYTPHPASYRDPSGFVFRLDGVYYRQVHRCYADHYDLMMRSGTYGTLTKNGLLVAHTEIDDDLTGHPQRYKILLPEQIPFISYPDEWSPSATKGRSLAYPTGPAHRPGSWDDPEGCHPAEYSISGRHSHIHRYPLLRKI